MPCSFPVEVSVIIGFQLGMFYFLCNVVVAHSELLNMCVVFAGHLPTLALKEASIKSQIADIYSSLYY